MEQDLPKGMEDDWLEIVTGENKGMVGKDKFLQIFCYCHKERLEYTFSEMRYQESKVEEVYAGDS